MTRIRNGSLLSSGSVTSREPSVDLEPCPCFWYDHDEGADRPDTCFCGHSREQHDLVHDPATGSMKPGVCRATIDPNAPYDPKFAEAALRLAERPWRSDADKP
jgi:hypothetical protein